MKTLILIMMASALAAHAEDPAAPGRSESQGTDAPRLFLGGSDPVLNNQQEAGVGITRLWEEKSYEAMVQAPGQDGSIQFRYGQSLPTIVCAILQVTDVELQPGEIVNEVKLGDTERWAVEPAVSGDATKTEHLVIKPRDIGLQTSLVVTTDHRTYHLELLSDARAFMHHVSFVYQDTPSPALPSPSPKVVNDAPDKPGKAAGGKVAFERPSNARIHAAPRSGGKETAASEKPDVYRIGGRAAWMPVSAYHDGSKTYIEMPRGMADTEAPALFVLKKSGLFGWGAQKNLVNYRVHGKWFVVDTVIDRAVLVAGVGSAQDKVTIIRSR